MSFKKKVYLISAAFLILLIIQASGLILHPTFASESTDITAPTVTITVTPDPNGNCSVSGGTCYTPTSAVISVSCTDNTGGTGCDGAPALTGTGTITPTTDATAHTAAATVTIAQTYSLSASASDLTGNPGSASYSFTISACDANNGAACNRNACGGTGVINCAGTCSAAAPNCPACTDSDRTIIGTVCNRTSGTGAAGDSCSSASGAYTDTYPATCTPPSAARTCQAACATGYSCDTTTSRCILPAPIISTLVCIPNGYAGTGYTISWTNPATPVTYVDISTDDFATYYHKEITGSAISTNGTGFNPSTGGGTALTYSPNTRYYVRLYNGDSSIDNRAFTSFTTPSLPTAQTPPACRTLAGAVPDGACGTTSYDANCSTSCNSSGACIPPTPAITTSNITNSCINDGYNGSGISINWTNNSTPVTGIDISNDADFGSFDNKYNSDGTSLAIPVTGPSGFYLWVPVPQTDQRYPGYQDTTRPLALDPGTTYYVRLWDGVNHSNPAATIPGISACCTGCAANTCTTNTDCTAGLPGTCTTSGANCTPVTIGCVPPPVNCPSNQTCNAAGSCVYSAWIKVRGDVHSNTRINATGGP